MPGDSCVVCGNSRKKAPKLSYHRFPTNQAKRSQWLRVFQLDPEVVKPHTRVCSRHFMNGDPIMHLSILCPTTPLPGYIGEKVGHLTCFDTKTCPICGEFDRSPYACATIKSTDGQIPPSFPRLLSGAKVGI